MKKSIQTLKNKSKAIIVGQNSYGAIMLTLNQNHLEIKHIKFDDSTMSIFVLLKNLNFQNVQIIKFTKQLTLNLQNIKIQIKIIEENGILKIISPNIQKTYATLKLDPKNPDLQK